MILHQPVYFLSQAAALRVDGWLCGPPGGLQTPGTVALSGLHVEGSFQEGRRGWAAACSAARTTQSKLSFWVRWLGFGTHSFTNAFVCRVSSVPAAEGEAACVGSSSGQTGLSSSAAVGKSAANTNTEMAASSDRLGPTGPSPQEPHLTQQWRWAQETVRGAGRGWGRPGLCWRLLPPPPLEEADSHPRNVPGSACRLHAQPPSPQLQRVGSPGLDTNTSPSLGFNKNATSSKSKNSTSLTGTPPPVCEVEHQIRSHLTSAGSKLPASALTGLCLVDLWRSAHRSVSRASAFYRWWSEQIQPGCSRQRGLNIHLSHLRLDLAALCSHMETSRSTVSRPTNVG